MRTVHRIDDLEHPRLPWPIRTFNLLVRPLAGVFGALDEHDLLRTARERTGLTDFGDESFREPLRVLLDALDREAHLSTLGRLLSRQLVIQLLGNRLRVEDLVRRHPEILEEEIEAPLFIVGLPRTGTTHLHNLLSQHPTLRSLPYWESLEPVPGGGERLAPAARDPRIRRCALGLRLQHYVLPLFPLMHEMTPAARHEEIQLLAVEFSTMLFETMYQVPSYRDWYTRSDQTGAYRYLRRLLQVLQWLRGPRRWVLKSPQHLEQVGPLLTVFPDARIVETHRDPVRVTASLCTMVAYGLRMQSRHVDHRAVGRYWADRVEDLLRAAVQDRHQIPAGQVMDVHFHAFVTDELATAAHVLEFAGHPLTSTAREAVEHYMAEHPRGRYGSVAYDLGDFGIDAAERRSALRFYSERFGVPDE